LLPDAPASKEAGHTEKLLAQQQDQPFAAAQRLAETTGKEMPSD